MDRRAFLQTLTAGTSLIAANAVSATANKAKKLSETAKPATDRPLQVFVMNRMGFGPREKDIKPVFQFDRYVEAQLNPSKIEDLTCEEKLKKANLKTLSLSLKELYQTHHEVGDSDAKKELKLQPVRETEMATWIRAVYSEKQLQEALVQFWHDHFNVNGWDQNISPVMPAYDKVIRENAFGNFRTFLEAIAKSTAMLMYLDNGVNQSGNPNENFARELFELHTLGVENYLGTMDRKNVPGYTLGKVKGYVDGDVYEAARCFTGWRFDGNQKDAKNTGEFSYFEQWHDRFQKIVLGHSLNEYQPPMKDGHDVLDLLANHEGTAHYVSKKLCKRFIGDNVPDTLVKKVAKVFHDQRKSPDQIKSVMRVILMSPEFRDPAFVKVKRPFEYSVAMIRLSNIDFDPTEDVLNKQARLGQRLFQWKTPDGYPDSIERWANSSALLHRWQFVSQILKEDASGLKDLQKTLSDEDHPESVISKKTLGYSSRSLEKTLALFFKDKRKPNGKLPPPVVKAGLMLALVSPETLWK